MLLVSVASATEYRVDVDSDYGFYRVVGVGVNESKYVNYTLFINAGDSVTWINDDSYDLSMTIVSTDRLWNNSKSRLRYNYQRFNYTFNGAGLFDFYIKEYPKLKHMNVVVVAPIPISTEMVCEKGYNKVKDEFGIEWCMSSIVVTTNDTINNSIVVPIEKEKSDISVILKLLFVFIMAFILLYTWKWTWRKK